MEHATLLAVVEERPDAPPVRYKDDLHAWAMEQAENLKAGRFAALDLTNLADEIADVGHSQCDELVSDPARVIQHLLEWDHQPHLRGRSWVNTIREHRRRVERQLRRVPSLRARAPEILVEAHERGRGDALIETGLDEAALPGTCPFTWDEAMIRAVAWPAP